MSRTVRGWNAIYGATYGRCYPFEPLVVYVSRLKTRGFVGLSALDIGFGTVADMVMLHDVGYAVHGIEVAENAVTRAGLALDNAGIPHDLRLWTPGTQFPHEDHHFDLVVSIGALHYNLDQMPVLAEIQRVLRGGGRFMTTYHGPLFHYWRFSEVVRPGIRRYTDEYPNEAMRGIEFVYFDYDDEISALYSAYFDEVEVSHYQYRLLGQDTSFWLVTGCRK